MAELAPGQQLEVGGELTSDNGWFRLVLQGDGNVVVYRAQTGGALWATSTDGKDVASLAMQADGNLVAYSSQGAAQWSTGTFNHPGATLQMRNDGNVVVRGPAGGELWSSGSAQNLASPTLGYSDSRGFSYVETSETWKDLCKDLPCFLALQWPGYASGIVEMTVSGEKAVIQWWNGWCPKFLGLPFFPGGIGAEVGVYRREPGRARPTSLPFLPTPLATKILAGIAGLADNDLWWPAPDLLPEITFTLTNPVTGQLFFDAGPERSYWLAKWMNEGSYLRYQASQGVWNTLLPSWFPGNARTPAMPDGYRLTYTVSGKRHSAGQVTGPRAAQGTLVSAAVRDPDHLDIFMTDSAGTVRTAAWEPSFTDGWHGWWDIRGIRCPAGAPVHAVSRGPGKLDVFAADESGVILTAAWEPSFTDGWHGWWEIAGGRAARGAAVTAASRGPDKLDVFVVGTDGRVYTAAWEPAFTDGWHGWWGVGDLHCPAGAPIHAVSRSAGKLDIFATDVNGVIRTAAWEPAFTDGWHGWWEIAGGRAAPGAPVTAVSRGPDKLDVFVVGTDGRVYTAAWEPAFTDGWHGWWPIGDVHCPQGAPVHAVSRGPDMLDIFVTDVGGRILTAAWQPAFTDGWHGWWTLAGGQAAAGTAVWPVSRSRDKLDVFVAGTDGRVWTAAWEPAFTGGWHGWWAVGGP